MSHIATHNEHLQPNTRYRLTTRVTPTGTVQTWKPTPAQRNPEASHIRQAYTRRRR